MVIVSTEEGELKLTKCSDMADSPVPIEGSLIVSEEAAEILKKTPGGSLGKATGTFNSGGGNTAAVDVVGSAGDSTEREGSAEVTAVESDEKPEDSLTETTETETESASQSEKTVEEPHTDDSDDEHAFYDAETDADVTNLNEEKSVQEVDKPVIENEESKEAGVNVNVEGEKDELDENERENGQDVQSKNDEDERVVDENERDNVQDVKGKNDEDERVVDEKEKENGHDAKGKNDEDECVVDENERENGQDVKGKDDEDACVVPVESKSESYGQDIGEIRPEIHQMYLMETLSAEGGRGNMPSSASFISMESDVTYGELENPNLGEVERELLWQRQNNSAGKRDELDEVFSSVPVGTQFQVGDVVSEENLKTFARDYVKDVITMSVEKVYRDSIEDNVVVRQQSVTSENIDIRIPKRHYSEDLMETVSPFVSQNVKRGSVDILTPLTAVDSSNSEDSVKFFSFKVETEPDVVLASVSEESEEGKVSSVVTDSSVSGFGVFVVGDGSAIGDDNAGQYPPVSDLQGSELGNGISSPEFISMSISLDDDKEITQESREIEITQEQESEEVLESQPADSEKIENSEVEPSNESEKLGENADTNTENKDKLQESQDNEEEINKDTLKPLEESTACDDEQVETRESDINTSSNDKEIGEIKEKAENAESKTVIVEKEADQEQDETSASKDQDMKEDSAQGSDEEDEENNVEITDADIEEAMKDELLEEGIGEINTTDIKVKKDSSNVEDHETTELGNEQNVTEETKDTNEKSFSEELEKSQLRVTDIDALDADEDGSTQSGMIRANQKVTDIDAVESDEDASINKMDTSKGVDSDPPSVDDVSVTSSEIGEASGGGPYIDSKKSKKKDSKKKKDPKESKKESKEETKEEKKKRDTKEDKRRDSKEDKKKDSSERKKSVQDEKKRDSKESKKKRESKDVKTKDGQDENCLLS